MTLIKLQRQSLQVRVKVQPQIVLDVASKIGHCALLEIEEEATQESRAHDGQSGLPDLLIRDGRLLQTIDCLPD